MKKAIKIVFNVIAWIVLVLALVVTILVFTADRNNGVATLLGYMPMTVESDSMKPTFKKNDLIIVSEIDDFYKLEKGDVITFWTMIDNKKVKNTHRIVEINEINGNRNFITKGDNSKENDEMLVYPGDIIGQWTEVKIPGFGKVMSFLRTKTGFFICILIPMAIFFLFELYKLIVVIVDIKRPATLELDEEEIKRKAIEEYISQQKQSENQQNENAETNEIKTETDEAQASEVNE